MLETIRVVWCTWSARFFELIGSAVLCNMLWCASFLEDSLWMICFLSFRQLNWNLLIFWMFSPDSSIIFYSCKGPLPLFLSCEKFYNALVTSVNSMPFNAFISTSFVFPNSRPQCWPEFTKRKQKMLLVHLSLNFEKFYVGPCIFFWSTSPYSKVFQSLYFTVNSI